MSRWGQAETFPSRTSRWQSLPRRASRRRAASPFQELLPELLWLRSASFLPRGVRTNPAQSHVKGISKLRRTGNLACCRFDPRVAGEAMLPEPTGRADPLL